MTDPTPPNTPDPALTNRDEPVSAKPVDGGPSRLPWRRRYAIILPLLIVAYPVGLVLLFARKRTGVIWRTLLAVAALPIFALLVLLALRPYWVFDGGMQRFWLDFTKGGSQSKIVAQHRAQQRAAASHLDPDASDYAQLWYPAFRGPNRDGIIPGDFIALDWNAHPPREIWRQPVGDGWSSFAVGYGRLYTLEQRGDNEAITCYDIGTGIELWAHEYPACFTESLGGDGPRSTPTLHDGRVYALGADGHLTCVDARSGQRYWQHEINDEFEADNLQWAMSASPFVHRDTVIVTNSGVGGGSVIAYKIADGTLAWSRDVGQLSYSSPVVARVAGREQLLNLAGSHLNGLDPTNGELLWSFPFRTDLQITASQPIVVGDDRLFISAGYGLGCAMLELRRDGDTLAPVEVWSNIRMKNKFTSSVLHDGYLYGLDERHLACLDADSGERKWKGGRYDYGSVLLVQGHLLVLSEEGELALVEATPEAFMEIARIRILNDKTWNNHALVGGLLFARNHREMVCYDLRP